jgi:hypothetical protein
MRIIVFLCLIFFASTSYCQFLGDSRNDIMLKLNSDPSITNVTNRQTESGECIGFIRNGYVTTCLLDKQGYCVMLMIQQPLRALNNIVTDLNNTLIRKSKYEWQTDRGSWVRINIEYAYFTMVFSYI